MIAWWTALSRPPPNQPHTFSGLPVTAYLDRPPYTRAIFAGGADRSKPNIPRVFPLHIRGCLRAFTQSDRAPAQSLLARY